LVADQVYVASVAAHTPENPNPQQYIFSSSSDDNDFTTYLDPRGKTLERGTEITLVLKPDAQEYLDHVTLAELIDKHSVFSSSFPIYLFAQREKEVTEEPVAEPSTSDEENADRAEDEAVIEEVQDSPAKEVKTKKILVDEWDHVNARPSLWTRYLCLRIPGNFNLQRGIETETPRISPPSNMNYSTSRTSLTLLPSPLLGTISLAIWALAFPSVLSYTFPELYQMTSGRDLRHLPKAYVSWSSAPSSRLISAKTICPGGPAGSRPSLMVRKLPLQVLEGRLSNHIVLADDLPLSVSRETLQNASFLRQIKQTILKRIIQSFTKLAEDEPDKFIEAQKVYGNVFKLGAVEDSKNKDKLIPLIRFVTNQRNITSLDEVGFCHVYARAIDQLTIDRSMLRTRRLVRNKFSTSLTLARACHPLQRAFSWRSCTREDMRCFY